MNVGTTDLAAILGITPRQVTSLADQEVIPRAGRGQWTLAEAVQAYVRHKVRSEVARTEKPVSNAEDELKQIRIRRERRKEAVELGKLVPVEDAEFMIDEFIGLVRLHINNLPARYTRDLNERDRLQEHIDEVLNTVADGLEKCCQDLRADLDAYPAEAENPEDD